MESAFSEVVGKGSAASPLWALTGEGSSGAGQTSTGDLVASWLRSKTREEREAMRELDLSASEDLTDADLVLVAGMLPKLSSLNLQSCKLITDAGVMALSKGCPQLSSLYLISCELITDAGVMAMSKARPKLKIYR